MSNINIMLAKEKGLITDNDLKYQQVVKNYKYLFEYYLNSIIDFKKYEVIIDNSNLYIGKTLKYRELNEYLKLDYLFLINNLFVEKLDSNDIQLLQEFDKNGINDKLIEIIKRTFKDVIRDNYFKNEYTDKIYKVCYGQFVPANLVNNDSLVFRFYYGKNLVNLKGADFIKLDDDQLLFITNQMNLLKKEIHDKLNVNCEILIRKDID